ncbi:hypothetical protein FRB93_011347 [Tulasnella sp. JGI-2019a]|nr:hypothetical protein FRB93_011347 [Tulasnella sp. JGI-2019a]
MLHTHLREFLELLEKPRAPVAVPVPEDDGNSDSAPLQSTVVDVETPKYTSSMFWTYMDDQLCETRDICRSLVP